MKEIFSTQNEQVKNDHLLQTKKLRDDKGLFLVEGIKLILEAKECEFSIQRIYVEEAEIEKYQAELDELEKIDTIEIFKVPKHIIEKLSDVKGNQGVVAVVQKRENAVANPHNRSLILENLQDPKNVGSLLRTAVATSFLDVYLINCADPFSMKCIRASMSGIFKVNLHFVTFDECFETLSNVQILCGDMSGENVFETELIPQNIAIAVGNEGNGVTQQLKNKSTKTIKIPMDSNLESLNVAVSGSVLMYEIKRRNK